MVIFNSFSKKKCSLIGDTIMVHGVSYPVGYVRELKDFKTKAKYMLISSFVMGAIIYALLASAMLDIIGYIYTHGVDANICVSSLAWMSTAIIYSWFLRYTLCLRGYKCYFEIMLQGEKFLLLEDIDGEEVLNNLRRLEQRYAEL